MNNGRGFALPEKNCQPMLRCGILLPRSSLYPSFGLDILNGIKAYLRQAGCYNDINFISDNIGFGTDESDIYTKTEKMLLMDDADVVVVVADYRIAEMLEPLFAASNKLLIMVHPGANVPDSWQAGPTTITHTLNFCFLASLTGQLAAAETANKKGIYAISYYDTGYRHCYYLLNSHQKAGGIPISTHVTTLHSNEFTLAPIAEKLTAEPDVQAILALFTADMAADFYEHVRPLHDQFSLSIYAGPMLLDKILKEHTQKELHVKNTKGYACWYEQLDTPANKKYKEAFSGQAGKAANLLGILGWDAGTLLHQIIEQFKTGNKNAAAVVTALTATTYESPRGWMKLDASTHNTYSPAWLVSCAGDMDIQLLHEHPDTTAAWEQFSTDLYPAETSSGWRNTYLCI